MVRREGRGADGRATRARLEVDERRAQLLALGLEAFASRPYDEVSVDDVARAAGTSKGLLYHYFSNKRAFYVAVVGEAARQLLDQTQADPTLAPVDRARAGLDAYLAYVERHAAAYAALLRGGIGTDPAVAAVVERTRAEFVTRALSSIEPPPHPPRLRLTLRGWVGFVEATSLDWVEHRDVTRDELRELLLTALLALLAAPPP